MRKFKKGDKIYRPNHPESIAQVDDIQEIHQHYVCTSSEGERMFVPYFCENQWELVERAEPKHKFNVGDRVVLKTNPNVTHTITKVNEEDGVYYLDSGHRIIISFENEPLWVNELELKPEPELIKRYEDLANDYLTEFIKQTGIEEDAPFWVGGEVAGIACVADYFVDYKTIRYVVDGKMSFEDFDKWYNYCADVKMIDDSIFTPTLEQWCYGEFTRISDERLKEMKKLKKDFEQLVQEEKEKQNT
jgi:hypothetical protein